MMVPYMLLFGFFFTAMMLTKELVEERETRLKVRAFFPFVITSTHGHACWNGDFRCKSGTKSSLPEVYATW